MKHHPLRAALVTAAFSIVLAGPAAAANPAPPTAQADNDLPRPNARQPRDLGQWLDRRHLA